MARPLRRFLRRILPDALSRSLRHARARLWLSQRPADRAWREQFLHQAFTALVFNGIDGDYAEFGSGGMTFGFAYQQARRSGHPARLWSFDSFRGLPPPVPEDEHPEWKEGRLATSRERFELECRSYGVPREAYEVVEGFYADTLTRMAPTDEPTNICLAYVDCDMYSSTKLVLDFLAPRLKHGMVIAFDDYYCWSSTQPAGNRRAAREFLAGQERWHLLPYLQYGWHGASFVVEDRRLLEGDREPGLI
ncbi:MAG: TylF/MycF/NovP-related O-methyltransferase [Planctomycetota bacterium]|jgi:hypothetical protein